MAAGEELSRQGTSKEDLGADGQRDRWTDGGGLSCLPGFVQPDPFFTGRSLHPMMELNTVVSFFPPSLQWNRGISQTLTFLRKICSLNR